MYYSKNYFICHNLESYFNQETSYLLHHILKMKEVTTFNINKL